MGNDEEIVFLKSKVDFLEKKCAYLIKQLEDALLSVQDHPAMLKSLTFSSLEQDVFRLRAENERLQGKVDRLYDSVSWRLTKPLRQVNLPTIDRWIKGR